ncbi:hypothetical protein HHI36_007851 [Cryptolaemus montrouzieri]|uniref:Uncharacterized protein n=1 Tax=Cryptolaemus montrouzieri TaxID=559131 RepID=A0ABD2MQN5_9CUCU
MQGLSQKTSINILQKFHNDNPDYEKIKLSDKVKLRLNEGDEVYIMQVPKTINPKILKGVSFSLSKKSKLKTEAGKYIMKQQPESPSPVLLFSNELQKVSPISTFKMEKYIKTKDQKEVLVEEKENMICQIILKLDIHFLDLIMNQN